jgi:3-methylfumaryl-CoA hydratase
MFAGGEVTFGEAPLRVGEQVTVTTELGDIAEKAGRSGDFVLAAFTTTVCSLSGDVALTERQDIVYTHPRPGDLDAPQGALPIVGRPLVPRPEGGLDLVTDPTLLLRFSALTNNAHRIHYDMAYAKDVEGLPGLLVQGPLINLALAGLGSGGRPVRRIRHRNLSPLFVGQPAVLATMQTAPGEITAEATSGDGRTTSRVVLELQEMQENHT